jgi:hypothetical protein
MYHPLLADPSTLKDSELESKIIDLSQKYHTAARFGQGVMCDQIVVILDSLKQEQSKRSQNMLKKTVNDQNKDLSDLIKVN